MEDKHYNNEVELLSVDQVIERLGIARTTLFQLRRNGAFPKPSKLSANRVAFFKHEIREWLESRRAQY